MRSWTARAVTLTLVKTFDQLFAELTDKAATRPSGSGTVVELDAGVHAIGKKIVEEAAEVWMAAEYEGNTPWVPRPSRPVAAGEQSSPTLLGLGLWDHGRTEHAALAWVQPHVRWIEWINEASAG